MELKNHRDLETIKFGQQLVFDAYGCDYEVMDSITECTKILNELVDLIKMRKLLEPVVVNASPNTAVGGEDPGGNSGFVIVQESHISIHTFSKRGFVTIDVYSCKSFDETLVIDYLRNKLKPKDFDTLSLGRGLKYPKENIY